ncbi:MAG: hypothetical protein RLZZ624_976 [Cyanobacteriota bacterium]|jgi:putative membrane protein insertion efficiency factor
MASTPPTPPVQTSPADTPPAPTHAAAASADGDPIQAAATGETSHPWVRRLNGLIAAVLLALIQLYRQGISPLIGPRCRFIPTCSAYGLEAIQRHGPWRGGWLTLRRLLRCHPFTPCGCDPVPD